MLWLRKTCWEQIPSFLQQWPFDDPPEFSVPFSDSCFSSSSDSSGLQESVGRGIVTQISFLKPCALTFVSDFRHSVAKLTEKLASFNLTLLVPGI
jgi:hypothetical protein